MKPCRISLLACAAAVLTASCGCGQKDGEDEAGRPEESRVKLCGFEANHGVFVNDDIRRALELTTMEVLPKTLPQIIRGTARVFAPGKASILVDTNTARAIRMGQQVGLADQHEATVVALERLSGLVEVIVEFPGDAFNIGANVAAKLPLPGGEALPAVPASSVIHAATGDYVFVVNGRHFLRTPVKVAVASEEWVAIADGLLEGDIVVTNGVAGLWRIELQATKGGYACCAIANKE
jgi:hypothetical protein